MEQCKIVRTDSVDDAQFDCVVIVTDSIDKLTGPLSDVKTVISDYLEVSYGYSTRVY